METRTLGRTGLAVSVLGFGTAEIGFFGTDVVDVGTILNEALDHGLTLIDTAECYMDSEAKIGQAVGHRRSEFVLATKLGHTFEGGPELEDWSRELLTQSVDHSLQALRTDHVDLLQVHSCSAEVLAQGDVLEVIQKAKADGKTRFLGYSGDGEDAVAALKTGLFDTLQTSCSIADQESIDLLLPLAREQNLGVIVKRPVANVAWINGDEPPTRKYAETYWHRLQKLRFPFLKDGFDEAFGNALRFTAFQPGVTSVIVGSQKPGRWVENARLLEQGPLPDDELKAIRDRWHEVAEPDWVGQT